MKYNLYSGNHTGKKLILSILFSVMLAFCISGCSGQWDGPDLEKQRLETESISNARQLGGYPAADGKQVKENVLIRSGALYEASAEDLEMLKNQYGLEVIVDLRTSEEAAENPDPVIEGVDYYHLPLMEEGGSNSQEAVVEIYRLYGETPGRAYVEMVRAGALSEDIYTCFLSSEEALDAWNQFFDVLLSHDGDGAVLLHCTGGKDRAGLTTVILLSALGVDKEVILADFALTNEALSEKISYITAEAENYTSDPEELKQVEALIGVSVPHMEMVFGYVEAEYGSMAEFIQQGIGLTDEEVCKLRKMYLE